MNEDPVVAADRLVKRIREKAERTSALKRKDQKKCTENQYVMFIFYIHFRSKKRPSQQIYVPGARRFVPDATASPPSQNPGVPSGES